MSGPNEHLKTAVAGGNIRRSRVVMMTSPFTVVEMSTNLSFPAFGIAQEWTRNPPGTPFDTSLRAAESGDELRVYGPGSEGKAECGGTVTAGKYVTADGTARIVDAGGSPPWSFHVVGRALEDGAAGDVIRVQVGA